MKAKKEKAIQFNVIFEKDEDGYFVASVPELEGCYTQGRTLEEARKRIDEAIRICLKDDPSFRKKIDAVQKPRFIGIDTITVNYV